MEQKRIPAIVLGSGITALGVLRSLSEEKITTFYISDIKDYTKFSRWANLIYLIKNQFPTTDELAEVLENLPFDRAVLFPCSDRWLKAVINIPPDLQSRFPSSLPSLKTLKILIDKGEFGKILANINVPHPLTIIIHDSDQIKSLDKNYFNGFFFKPRHSIEFQDFFRTKGFRVFSLEDALARFQKIRDAGQEIMLQEYIPGPTTNHYFIDGFIDRRGKFIALFARRRERIYPPDFGNSSYCVSVPLSEVGGAIESLNRLMKHIEYRGIFSIEFKLDPRDNLFKILEVNARPWWYIKFATSCGVNTCKLAYQDALGLPINTVSDYDVGVGCMYSLFDLLVAIKMFKNKKLSLKSWLSEFLAAEKPIFSWRDPIPAIMNFAQRLKSYFLRKVF